MNCIKENTEDILNRIDAAARKNGRIGKDITLIGVTKTVECERISQSIEAGITNIGENYVNELCEKYETVSKYKINIHFIGHLQRNKVKYIVDKVNLIQSVDSFRLGAEIDKQCAKINKVMDVLVEVNIGDEESKSGVSEIEAEELVTELAKLEHIRVCGLMCIPPKLEDIEFFKKMKAMFERFKTIDGVSMDILSMGMSADFECAIECGATMVRVGTAIYGERNYNK